MPSYPLYCVTKRASGRRDKHIEYVDHHVKRASAVSRAMAVEGQVRMQTRMLTMAMLLVALSEIDCTRGFCRGFLSHQAGVGDCGIRTRQRKRSPDTHGREVHA